MANNTKSKKTYIKRDYSKSPLRGFNWGGGNSLTATVFPNFDFQSALEMIELDPVATGAVNHFVDKFMEGDYSIIRREDRKYDRIAELRLEEKYMFRTKVLRKVALLGKLFNNVFLEIVRDSDGRTKAINILDSTTVDAITAPNGDLIKLVSKLTNTNTGQKPEWVKNDIVWIKFGDRTEGWAPVDIKAIWNNLVLKKNILRYVNWLWETGQYRIIYKFKSSSNQDITDFLTFARKNDVQFNIPFVAKGDIETTLLRDMKEVTYYNEMLKYLDSQTLILLRIPPIDAGIPDASGRSSADAQANSVESTITSMKKTVQDYINFDLFPKINKSTFLIEFGPMNRFAFKQFIGVAKELRDIGMSDDAIEEYLKDSGIFFEAATLFKKVEDPMTAQFGSKTEQFKKKDAGESNKVLDEVSTREDQLKKV